MKTILLTNKYPEGPYKIISSCVPDGFRLLMLDEVSQEDLVKKAPEADYILASGRLKIDEPVIKAATKLKMVQRTGVGLDALDLDLLRERNIPLYVNNGVNADSVAEHALLLILSCLRRLPEVLANTKGGQWIKQAQGVRTFELRGKTVGVIGLGNIGQKVAHLLNAFGAQVICHTYPDLTESQQQAWNVKQLPLDEVISQSDIITLHCPLTPDTKELICKGSIEKMKDNVVIVNTARGQLVNEADLLDALNSGKVSFVGLDVFNSEPPIDWAIIKHPHVVSTPHIGGVTYDSFHGMMHDAMANMYHFERGELETIAQNKYL